MEDSVTVALGLVGHTSDEQLGHSIGHSLSFRRPNKLVAGKTQQLTPSLYSFSLTAKACGKPIDSRLMNVLFTSGKYPW